MPNYIRPAISIDPDGLTEASYEALQALVPGWQPSDGALDTIILQVVARMSADLREFMSDMPDTIFNYFGQTVMEVVPETGSQAFFLATFTTIDTLGYVIPAGTEVGVRMPDGTLASFQVVADTTITAGTNTVTGVTMTSLDVGAKFNGLLTADLLMVDPLTYISDVVGDAATRGGSDAETDDEYLNRLVQELRLMSPRPILVDDFTVLARRVDGVGRAYAINLYDAVSGLTGVEKTITLYITDDNGEVVSSTVKTNVLNYLQALREVNFVIYVRDPAYQNVTVAATVTAIVGYDPADVDARVSAAVDTWLSPLTWGLLPTGDAASGLWRPNQIVRYLDVASVIKNVEGVDYINSLTLNGGTSDVTLVTGGIKVTLPRSSPAAAITVNAGS